MMTGELDGQHLELLSSIQALQKLECISPNSSFF